MTSPAASPDSALSRAAALCLAAVFLLYAALAFYGVVYGRTWIDEISYVVKSWWYVSGTVAPYSDQDATWYMPLYFYELGWAQKIFGQGHITGRALSAVFGAGAGVLTFLIARRLVAAPAAVFAAALVLLTPTTVYYFTTATPISTVAFLLLLAVYLILRAPPRPSAWLSAGLGVLFAAIYFYRQNMVLGVAPLALVYLWRLEARRGMHAAWLAFGALGLVLPLLVLFPARLGVYALRLPIVMPVLHLLGLLPDALSVDRYLTDSRYTMNIDTGRLAWRDPVNAFLLPFLGTNLLALAVFYVRRSQRILWLAPALFFFLAAGHYLGSIGYCPACILTYTSYFIGIGAVAAALAIDVLWRRAPAQALAVGAAGIVLNAVGTAFAVPDAGGAPSLWAKYPLLMVSKVDGLSDLTAADRLADIIMTTTPDKARVVVLDDQPQLAYALARTGRTFPVQGFNLRQSYRRVRADLPEAEKAGVIRALEAESFWTDTTLLSWLDNPATDAVMVQENAIELSPAARASLMRNFRPAANVLVLNRLVTIYLRSAQPAAAPPSQPTPEPAPSSNPSGIGQGSSSGSISGSTSGALSGARANTRANSAASPVMPLPPSAK